MKYVELSVRTTPEGEDLVADVFLRYIDIGVSVSSAKDAGDYIKENPTAFDYVDDALDTTSVGVSFVKGSFPLETAKEDIALVKKDLEDLKRSVAGIIDIGSLTTTERVFENDDWIKNWREHFKPIFFDKLCVCPTWIECDTDKQKVLIGTDLAFGTGEHETTSMCIKYLEKFVSVGDTVIDVGSGSGILGICAAKLGAKKVYMTDNDPQAVFSSGENIKINGVENIAAACFADLVEKTNVTANVVVANITAEILMRLAESIKDRIAEDGTLILSGILKDRIDKVVDKYAENGFEFLEKTIENEWSAVVLKKS